MLRITKPVMFISCGIMIFLMGFPWVSKSSLQWVEWMHFLGSFYPFVMALPFGCLVVLWVIEIGRLSLRSQWELPICWVSFLVAVSSSLNTMLYYCHAVGSSAVDSRLSSPNLLMLLGSLAAILMFLAKFSAITTRQKRLDKLYILMLTVSILVTSWSFIDEVIEQNGNPLELAPWKNP